MKPPKRPTPGKRRLGVSSIDPGIQRMLAAKMAGRKTADTVDSGPGGMRGDVAKRRPGRMD